MNRVFCGFSDTEYQKQPYIKRTGENKMARKDRRTKTVEEKYGEYIESTIRLSEDGIIYEVLLDKYIKLMEKFFEEKADNKTTYDAKMTIFLEELEAKFRREGKERLAKGCGSSKTFGRYFDKSITKKKGPVSMEDEKKCIHIIKDMEVFFDTKLLITPKESLYKKNEYIHSLILPLIDIMV